VRQGEDGRIPARRARRATGRLHRFRRLGAPHVRHWASRGRPDLLRSRVDDGGDSERDPDLRVAVHRQPRSTGFPGAAPVHRRIHRAVRDRRALRDHVRRDSVRPGDDRHVLRRRPLPLHHLRRSSVSDPGRDVLLVPEGHRTHVPRALGPALVLGHVPRHAADVLSHARRGGAGARARPRDACHDRARRLRGRRPPHALRVALADRGRALTDGRLRHAADDALRGRRDLRRTRRPRPRRVARQGAGGRVNAVPYTHRVAKPNGWWGMIVFVATEATLFGTLIGGYYDLRFKTPEWPPPGVPDPKVLLPLILLAVLVSTSVPVQLASSFARARRVGAARLALLL